MRSKSSRASVGTSSSLLCRTAGREHVPKRWGNLEEPPAQGKVFDNTHDRIHGQKQYETYLTHNHTYGVAKNPVDEMPRMGMRDHILEANA